MPGKENGWIRIRFQIFDQIRIRIKLIPTDPVDIKKCELYRYVNQDFSINFVCINFSDMDPNYEGGSRLKKNADPDPVAKLMRIRERYSEKQVFSPTNL